MRNIELKIMVAAELLAARTVHTGKFGGDTDVGAALDTAESLVAEAERRNAAAKLERDWADALEMDKARSSTAQVVRIDAQPFVGFVKSSPTAEEVAASAGSVTTMTEVTVEPAAVTEGAAVEVPGEGAPTPTGAA